MTTFIFKHIPNYCQTQQRLNAYKNRGGFRHDEKKQENHSFFLIRNKRVLTKSEKTTKTSN